MVDQAAIQFDRRSYTLTERDVERAVSKLSRADQKRFMALHEGNRRYDSKAFRIYKANAFGDTNSSTLYLDVSLLNHSCVLNASLKTAGLKGRAEVVAMRSIWKGEEIFISYRDNFCTMTKEHRSVVSKIFWGFECGCSACTMEPREQAFSDSRRLLLSVVMANLQGAHPVPPAYFDFLGSLDSRQVEKPGVLQGFELARLRTALTVQQRTACFILQAKLLEAEGICDAELATAYMGAASGLQEQITGISKAHRGLIVPRMAQLMVDWFIKSADIFRHVSGPRSENYRTVCFLVDVIRGPGPIRFACAQIPRVWYDTVAVRPVRQGNPLPDFEEFTEEQCNRILAGQNVTEIHIAPDCFLVKKRRIEELQAIFRWHVRKRFDDKDFLPPVALGIRHPRSTAQYQHKVFQVAPMD